ncbi:MAG: hypothetical protein JJW01_00155 [Alphaproteobacteria bacterium]|nr:hypothetical protein [Rickettsiales bacterium]
MSFLTKLLSFDLDFFDNSSSLLFLILVNKSTKPMNPSEANLISASETETSFLL